MTSPPGDGVSIPQLPHLLGLRCRLSKHTVGQCGSTSTPKVRSIDAAQGPKGGCSHGPCFVYPANLIGAIRKSAFPVCPVLTEMATSKNATIGWNVATSCI